MVTLNKLPHPCPAVVIDWIVGSAIGKELRISHYDDGGFDILHTTPSKNFSTWSPTFLWEQAGPIIQREKISLIYNDEFETWVATIKTKLGNELGPFEGKHPLEVAMRAFCYLKFHEGNTFEVPEFLFNY